MHDPMPPRPGLTAPGLTILLAEDDDVVFVLTTSDAETDIAASYGLGANCYLQKPLGMDAFSRIIKGVEDFWLSLAKLPPRGVAWEGRP